MSTPEEPIVVSEVTVVLTPNEVAVTKLSTTLELNAPGPQGPRGPAGPAGAAGGSVFEHVQSVPASTWTLQHNFGRRSHCTLIDPDGVVVEADIEHADENTIVVTWPSPHTGTAIVS